MFNNSTSFSPTILTSNTYIIILTIILLLIFIFGLLFNIISISTIVCARAFQPLNMLILNLAIADLIYIFGIPLYLINLHKSQWPFGLFGCQCFFLFDIIGMTVGVYTIVALSIERYHDIAVVRKKNKSFRVFRFLIIIWLIAVIFALPIISNIKVITSEKVTTCETTWNDGQENIYFVFKFIFLYVLPSVLITISSIRILKFLKKWRQNSFSKKLTLDRLMKLKKQSIRKASSLDAICKAIKTNDSCNNNNTSNDIRLLRRKMTCKNRSKSTKPDIDCLLYEKQKELFFSQLKIKRSISMPFIKQEQPENSFTMIEQIDCIRKEVKIIESSFVNSNNGNINKQEVISKHLNKIIPFSYRTKMRRKVSRTVLMIIFMFLLQWTPMWLYQLYDTLHDSTNITQLQNLRIVNFFITIISYSNSISNPALYMFFTYNFKKNWNIIFRHHNSVFSKLSLFNFSIESKLKLNQFV